MAATTFLLTLLLAPRIDQAVVLGILLAGAVHFWREFRVGVDHWSDAGTLHIRPVGVLWFGTAEALKTSVLNLLADHPERPRVRFHMERVGRVDLTGALVLDGLVADLRSTGVEVAVLDVHPETARALHGLLAGETPAASGAGAPAGARD